MPERFSRAARVALLSVALALATASSAGSAPPQQPSLTPEQFIAARQASLDMSTITVSEMELAVKDGLDVKKQFYPAKTIARKLWRSVVVPAVAWRSMAAMVGTRLTKVTRSLAISLST